MNPAGENFHTDNSVVSKLRIYQLSKRFRPMADRVLCLGCKLREGSLISGGYEDGIVAKAHVPARRPGQVARDRSFE